MEFDTHSLFAYSTIKTVISQSSSTLIVTVQDGEGALFATKQQVITCPAKVQPVRSNAMIGRITSIVGDQLTIDISSSVREGSNTRTVKNGDQIANITTPKLFGDIERATITALAFSIAL